MKDYYKILGVGCNATPEQIKAAYRAQAIQWHPDRNPDWDTTEMMKDINEAYTILSNADSKRRYDSEYSYFKYAYSTNKSSNAEDYDIKDDNLKQDVNRARQSAEDFVKDFYANFKADAKTAAKGAWEGVKPFLITSIVITVIAFIAYASIGDDFQDPSSSVDYFKPMLVDTATSVPVSKDWTIYTIGNSFTLAVPPTIELRGGDDEYTKISNQISVNPVDQNMAIFQQVGLSRMDSSAMSKYCRIILQYWKGSTGDFMKSTETSQIDNEMKSELREMVIEEIGPYSSLIGEPTYSWKNIAGAIALSVKYIRSGARFNNENPVSCNILLFQNDNEMVKMVLAYRISESDLWAEQFDYVLHSFKWL